MFFVLSQAWDKEKNSESPWGIKPQTFRFCAPTLYHWAMEMPRWARSIMKFIWRASCILLGSATSMALCVSPHGDSEFFPKCPLARDKTKNIFLHFFTQLKTYHLYYFYLKTQSCLFWCCDVYFLSCWFICLFILPFFKISRNKRNDTFMNMAENLTCRKETYGETKRLVWATSWPCIVDQV